MICHICLGVLPPSWTRATAYYSFPPDVAPQRSGFLRCGAWCVMPCLSFDEVSQIQQRILWLSTGPTTVWEAWQAADARDKRWSDSANNAIRGLVGGFHAAGQGLRSCTDHWLHEVAKTWDWEETHRGVHCAESYLLVLLQVPSADPPNHCNQTTSIFSKILLSTNRCLLQNPTYLGTDILMHHYHRVDIRGLCRSEQQLRLATPRMHASAPPKTLLLWVPGLVCRRGIDDDPGPARLHCKMMRTDCCSERRAQDKCFLLLCREESQKADRWGEYIKLDR